MGHSVYDLKSFYAKRSGRLVRRLISSHMGNDFWGDLKGMRLMGYGYAVPYLRAYKSHADRVYAVMPERHGVHNWPHDEKNVACISSEAHLPLETESVDRIIAVHALEHAESLDTVLQEFWRVLKSNGRLLIVVPNRLGMWARADWTPLGHGTPYTTGQLHYHLKENFFVPERDSKALFMPPSKSFFVLRTAFAFESFGKFIFPGLAGVHMIEASKQVYAGVGKKHQGRAAHKQKIFVGNRAPVQNQT